MLFEAPLSVSHVSSPILQAQRAHRIIHIHLHLLLLLISFKVFLPHPHIHLDEHDVSCWCSSSLVMDTLWKGVLSYDNCSIDTLSNPSFYFETSYWKVYGYLS